MGEMVSRKNALRSRNSMCMILMALSLYLYNQSGMGRKRYILGFCVTVFEKELCC